MMESRRSRKQPVCDGSIISLFQSRQHRRWIPIDYTQFLPQFRRKPQIYQHTKRKFPKNAMDAWLAGSEALGRRRSGIGQRFDSTRTKVNLDYESRISDVDGWGMDTEANMGGTMPRERGGPAYAINVVFVSSGGAISGEVPTLTREKGGAGRLGTYFL